MMCWSFAIALYTHILLLRGAKTANKWWWAYHLCAWGVSCLSTAALFALDIVNKNDGGDGVVGAATFECWIGGQFPQLRVVLHYPLFWAQFCGIVGLYVDVIARNRAMRLDLSQNVFRDASAPSSGGGGAAAAAAV
ncbi:hypothetical protein HK100_012783, partial [Physocladia obscura]